MKNTTRLHTLRRGETRLLRFWKTALTVAVSAAAFSQPGLAQVPPASVLRIDTVNAVLYVEDTGDVSKFGTDPNVTTASFPKGFFPVAAVADIVAVNGQAVMGTHTRAAVNFGLSPAPTPGHPI